MFSGEKVTMRDLFAASLIGSANNATLAYVRELGIPEEEFVKKMNRKAIMLGLEQTEFSDVTGLDVGNISTAYEVVMLAHTAFTEYPDIAHMTSSKEYSFTVKESDREHTMRNSNKLMAEWGIDVSGGKTGYLYEARYCLVVKGVGKDERLMAVVLGSPSEVEHFADIKKLLNMDVN